MQFYLLLENTLNLIFCLIFIIYEKKYCLISIHGVVLLPLATLNLCHLTFQLRS